MRYKVKRRVDGDGPLSPELFESETHAKGRARELLVKHGARITIDIWNEDETWQVIAPPGVSEWCQTE